MTSPGAEALQGAQTVTVASSPTPQPGATFLQCAAQPGDSPQQYYIQGGQVLIQGRVQLILVKSTCIHVKKIWIIWLFQGPFLAGLRPVQGTPATLGVKNPSTQFVLEPVHLQQG